MATRLATAADPPNIRTMLLRTGSDGVSAYQELVQDWVVVVPVNQMRDELIAEVSSGSAKVVVYTTTGTTIRGCAVFRLVEGAWALAWVAIDKTLTAQQRLNGFRDAMRDVAGRVPGATKFFGITKVGGRLDLYLTPKLPKRTTSTRELPDGTVIPVVRFDSTATEMLAAIV